ncbi:hypothetical protein [Alysiella filiformis]|nr:hypothetical protein [Alysiella filiformis]
MSGSWYFPAFHFKAKNAIFRFFRQRFNVSGSIFYGILCDLV